MITDTKHCNVARTGVLRFSEKVLLGLVLTHHQRPFYSLGFLQPKAETDAGASFQTAYEIRKPWSLPVPFKLHGSGVSPIQTPPALGSQETEK